MNNYLKVGHRGASAYEPENTITTFQKAIEQNVDMVELDVHLSKNNDVIVMHDETINRTTNGRGKIRKMNLEELKSYSIDNNHKISTLQEVLEIINGKCAINIEIKNKKAAEEVLKIWHEYKLSSPSLISSNHTKALKYIKEQNPDIETALIYYATKTDLRQLIFTIYHLLIWPITKIVILRRAKKANVDWVNLSKEFTKKSFVTKLKKANFKVGVWVVNKKWQIKKIAKYEIDAIISDYPDRL